MCNAESDSSLRRPYVGRDLQNLRSDVTAGQCPVSESHRTLPLIGTRKRCWDWVASCLTFPSSAIPGPLLAQPPGAGSFIRMSTSVHPCPPLHAHIHIYRVTIAKVLKKIISWREKNHEKESVQLRPHEADLARPGDRNEGRSMRLLLRTIRHILLQRRANLRRR